MTKAAAAALGSLEPRLSDWELLPLELQRWLELEQTVNDQRFDPRAFHDVDDRKSGLLAELAPRRRPSWSLAYGWRRRTELRVYGPYAELVVECLGLDAPPSQLPFFLHPQAPAFQRRGPSITGPWRVTPTSSHRTVLAFAGGRRPLMLKLSLDAKVGGTRRVLKEVEIIRALSLSALLGTIPIAERRQLGFDWLADQAGLVETERRTGLLLRSAKLPVAPGAYLVPAFSLYATRPNGAPPLLLEWDGDAAKLEALIVDRLVSPYVSLMAYLLFRQGIDFEGHVQNVLFEADDRGLTGKIVLRDLTDGGLSPALRIAKGGAAPAWMDLRPRGAPIDPCRAAANLGLRGTRPHRAPGQETVERHGLLGFLWPINEAMTRLCRGYDAGRVTRAYLARWQVAAIHYLGIRPLSRWDGEWPRLATDDAIRLFLERFDWTSAGAVRDRQVPKDASPLRQMGPRRRRSAVTARVDHALGQLWLVGSTPAFFRPRR